MMASASLPAEEEPLVLSLQRAFKALLRRAAVLVDLTEAASEVDAFCASLEAVLQHGFKSRQFYLFTVHPWSLVEQSVSVVVSPQ